MRKLKKFVVFFIAFLITSVPFSSFSQDTEEFNLDKETMETVVQEFPDYYSAISQMSEEDLMKAKKQLEEMLAENNLSLEDLQPLAQELLSNFNTPQMQQQGTSANFDINDLSSMLPKEALDDMSLIQEYMPQLQEVLNQSQEDK